MCFNRIRKLSSTASATPSPPPAPPTAAAQPPQQQQQLETAGSPSPPQSPVHLQLEAPEAPKADPALDEVSVLVEGQSLVEDDDDLLVIKEDGRIEVTVLLAYETDEERAVLIIQSILNLVR